MYSELSQHYQDFSTGYWARRNAANCPCRGSGWALSQVDTWHKCPCHFHGQAHPEGQDASNELTNAERHTLRALCDNHYSMSSSRYSLDRLLSLGLVRVVGGTPMVTPKGVQSYRKGVRLGVYARLF